MSEDFKEKYNQYNGLIISPYDKRDYKFKSLIPLGVCRITDHYESPIFPFVYDQGDTQMCVACSYSAVRYLQESDNNQSELIEPFSPTFQYGNRDESEMFEGMYLRSCCKKGREGSILLRDLNEFCNTRRAMQLVKDRKDEFLKKAEPFKISSFYVCTSRVEVQQAILTTKAVIIGVPLYDCFFNVGKGGLINYEPNKNVYNHGGHAITVTGWKVVGDKLYWRILNSWGKSWGEDGYAWLPEEYPWVEQAYALVDNHMQVKYDTYLKEFYQTGSLYSYRKLNEELSTQI